MHSLYLPRHNECDLVTVYEESIDMFLRYNSSRFRYVDSADRADVVLIFEEWGSRSIGHLRTLLEHPFISEHANKVITINCDDIGRGFFPGCYTSLNPRNFLPAIHRACPYPYEYNQMIPRLVAGEQVVPSVLASFRGTDASHPLRKRLVQSLGGVDGFKVEVVRTKFHTHTDEQKQAYIDDILASNFVLCPRGWSPSTYRMYEVMSLSRCPVIISDDWIAPPGPIWDECSLRVSEVDLDRLPEILVAELPRARSLGRAARTQWEAHFSPEAKYREYGNSVTSIKQSLDKLVGYDCKQRWAGKEFLASNGWLLHQRVTAKLLSAYSKFRRIGSGVH